VADPSRPHPFELVFAQLRDSSFPAVRDALGDGDAGVLRFLLVGPAIELMRDLRPDEGLGEGVDDFVSLVHAAYRFWADGEQTVALDRVATSSLVNSTASAAATPERPGSVTKYIQVAPRYIWAAVDAESPYEPIDGWFAVPDSPALRVVACLGVHAERPGLSVIAAEGIRPRVANRSDGSTLFAPTMPGGERAGLHAVATREELLLLGWRSAGMSQEND
jgi:hypothetical protein